MKITDFMLYNKMLKNAEVIVQELDTKNAEDIKQLHYLEKKADELLKYGRCPKNLEQEIDRLMRVVQTTFFNHTEKQITPENSKTGKRMFEYAPVVPFVEPKFLQAGELYETDVIKKLRFLIKVIDNQKVTEDTYQKVCDEFEKEKQTYLQMKKDYDFSGKPPIFGKARIKYLQEKKTFDEQVKKVMKLFAKKEQIESFMNAINHSSGYLAKAISKVFADFEEYQENLPQEVIKTRETGEEIAKKAEDLKADIQTRNFCEDIEKIEQLTVLERFLSSDLPDEMKTTIMLSSLSDVEFNLLKDDNYFVSALEDYKPKKQTPIEKLIHEALSLRFLKQKTKPSEFGDE